MKAPMINLSLITHPCPYIVQNPEGLFYSRCDINKLSYNVYNQNKKNLQNDDLCAPSLKLRSAELRQKIVETILSSNLRQQCVNKTFAKTLF